MLIDLSHKVVREWVDKNLAQYVASISHRANLEQVPVVLTPTGKIKVKSTVFVMEFGTEEPKLAHDFLDWVHEQDFKGQWCVMMDRNTPYFLVAFANKDDAMYFKLRWKEAVYDEYTK